MFSFAQSSLERRALISGAILFAVMTTLIFGGVGTFAWWQGWMFLLVYFAWTVGVSVWLSRHDPALFRRRLIGGPMAEKRTAQIIIMTLILLGFIGLMIVPALDYRFGWSRAPLWLAPVGDAVFSSGWLIIVFVFKENTFTASTVEVMPGQTVVTTGPYAIVRHPMYAGGIFILVGMPLALGSWWGLTPIATIAPALIWRLLDEERMLRHDLPGYVDYMGKVRFRLVPGVW
jgi:protein-S-isoprenylcysteine O-methyltransferase Ste14